MLQVVGLLIMWPLCAGASPAASLQARLDAAPPGSTISLSSGTWSGPVVIRKPVVLEGHGRAVIDGGGWGSVITLAADGITLRGLIIQNSGDSHDQIDAAIAVRSSRNRIVGNRIRETLFGIDLREAHENQILDNDIASKDVELGLRGDGVRAWASNRNVFRGNRIHDSRDMIIWYSDGNLIENNQGWNNRYSLHFMYAGSNHVRRNRYWNSAVGIFLMYSHDATLEENDIRHAPGATGMGIGMKEVDNLRLLNNRILHCTTGLYLDQSPHDPYAFNLLLGNTVAYSSQGVVLHSTLRHNIFKGNVFRDNLEPLTVHANGTAEHNLWSGNYWDDYEGFDRDRNGYGDTAYVNRTFSGRLWMDDAWLQLFYGTPVLTVLDVLARLAPIVEPRVMLTDQTPLFEADSTLRLSPQNLHFRIPNEEEIEEELELLETGG